jgi:glutathione S-transferase
MLELYHNDMSSCAQKVRLTLAEKNLQWTGYHMDLRRGDTHTAEYKKLNPNGVVPTLITDGVVIIESTVIQEYLDDAYPENPLKPTDPCARAFMRLWTRQLDAGVHAALGSISLGTVFRYQIMEGRTEEELKDFIARIPDPEIRTRIHDLLMNGIESSYFAPALHRFVKLFSDMEETLQSGTWLAGEEYSLADIAYTPYLTRFDHLKYLGMLDNRPRLTDWYERVKARPNYRTGIEDWLNQSYLTLMKEKGKEAWPSVKRIVSGSRFR